ncbi:MAG: fasciclin domain-containing protein [Flavobacteriales bacterium]|nr:fasciclin domain-containing protein [Flavobacteriales bacterium]
MKQFLMVLGFFMLASGSLVFGQDNPCGVEGVVVEASSTQFTPSNVEIEMGQTVVWVNVQGTHDVNGVDSSIGESWNNPETFSFGAVVGNSEGVCIGSHTFTMEGIYDYDCSIGNHAQNGMVATVVVTSPPPPVTTVMDIIAGSDDHTLLEAAILAAGLDDALNGEGPLTVFAPTDDAITSLLGTLGITAEELLASPMLSNILLYHVAGGLVMSSDLSDNQSIEMLQGDFVLININGDLVTVNQDAVVTEPDLSADNGVVHVIDEVLLPTPDQMTTVLDIINASDSHTTLQAAIVEAGLEGALSSEGPLTVFAPTDAAFEALATALGVTVSGLLASPNLSEILQHHVVDGLYLAADLPEGTILSSLIGDDLVFTIMEGTDMVHVNDAMVIVPDLTADNGVVHVIDAVLLPTISGIEEAEKGLALQLFPNPVSQDMVQLTGNWDAGSTLVVCDASGRLVFSQPMSSGTHTWNVEGLPVGMYSATVLSGLTRQTVSLIVQ